MTKSQKPKFCPYFRPYNARIFTKMSPSEELGTLQWGYLQLRPASLAPVFNRLKLKRKKMYWSQIYLHAFVSICKTYLSQIWKLLCLDLRNFAVRQFVVALLSDEIVTLLWALRCLLREHTYHKVVRGSAEMWYTLQDFK